MIAQSEDHVAQLVDEVTSPGGTTSRALQVLKKGRMAAVVTDSVDAAYSNPWNWGEAFPRNDQGIATQATLGEPLVDTNRGFAPPCPPGSRLGLRSRGR